MLFHVISLVLSSVVHKFSFLFFLKKPSGEVIVSMSIEYTFTRSIYKLFSSKFYQMLIFEKAIYKNKN